MLRLSTHVALQQHGVVRWLREPVFLDLLRIIAIALALVVGIEAWRHL